MNLEEENIPLKYLQPHHDTEYPSNIAMVLQTKKNQNPSLLTYMFEWL